MSGIKDFLPKPRRGKLMPVQGMIPEQLHEAVAAQKKKDDLTWNELVEACLKRYLVESGVKVPSSE